MNISDIRCDKKIPEEVKDLIIPIVARLQQIESQVAGSIELAYRRGKGIPGPKKERGKSES